LTADLGEQVCRPASLGLQNHVMGADSRTWGIIILIIINIIINKFVKNIINIEKNNIFDLKGKIIIVIVVVSKF